MGNRALIIFTDGDRVSPVVYLHWCGGQVPAWLILGSSPGGPGLMLGSGEPLAEFLVLQAEPLHLFRCRVGLLVLDGKPVPGMLPPTVGLQVDIEGFDQREHERLARELLSVQHVAESAARKLDSL